jgi:hypothetical protein
MTNCGSCPTCTQGIPVCVGGVCVAPEEALVQGSFLFATFAMGFNWFVAQRDSVKRKLSQNTRAIIFLAIPVIIFAALVQHGLIEVPTLEAVENSFWKLCGYTNTTKNATAAIRAHLKGHGHSHGHAEWHVDAHGHGHIGHFHHDQGHDHN